MATKRKRKKKKGKRKRDTASQMLAGSRRRVHFTNGGTIQEWRPKTQKIGNKKKAVGRKKCRGRVKYDKA